MTRSMSLYEFFYIMQIITKKLQVITSAKKFKVTTDYLLGIENRREIDLSGLSEEEVASLLNLIKAMKR